jgi:hypothetical protein
MSAINKQLMRLAVALHARLARRPGDRLIELPVQSWQRCAEIVRQIRRAELRGWQLAGQHLRTNLRHTIPRVETALDAIVSQLPRITTSETLASIGDIYRDLVAIENEFDDVDYHLRDRWLSATTEPIELAGVALGPFEIRLEWTRTGDEPAYRVIAKDPHPAKSNSSVTHPHVMDERLCEGDGRSTIHQALAQGRLLDFFMLVAGGLRTYNPESPFVALEIWGGATCSDCGAVVDEDEWAACQRCEETICSGCEVACSGCDGCWCSQCVTSCRACDENYCRGCLQSCKACRASVCRGCLDDDERCFNCHEKERQENSDQIASVPHAAAVQPDGLGQAFVPA